MQYNAPDTIYYKQVETFFLSVQFLSFCSFWCANNLIWLHNYFQKAHTIEELAKKKFQRLRNNAERSEKEIKSEQITSNSLAKKQIKKPMSLTAQEPVGSDFSSGATLATAGDFQSGLNATQAGGGERLSNVDGPAEGNTTLIDNNLEKVEDLLSGMILKIYYGCNDCMPWIRYLQYPDLVEANK